MKPMCDTSNRSDAAVPTASSSDCSVTPSLQTRTDPTFVSHHVDLVADPAMQRFAGRRRVVVATADALSPRMAGPAIRATRIARALAAAHEVRLVSITQADLELDDVEVLHVQPDPTVEADGIDELIEWCDIFVFQGWVLSGRESVARSDRIFVADIYDPLHLEQLEQSRDEGEHQRRGAVRHATAVLNDQLLRGDYLLCASEKQRDLWLGQLAALGRVNPATYDDDPDLRALLDVVPFGIEDDPPTRTGPGFRGVIPGVGPDDPVILWGGGIYNWFDPLTLLRAVDRLRVDQPTVRLVFMGMRHPNPGVPEMRMAVATRHLSDELGLTDTHVFFNEGWVPYDERQNHLLDADIAVSTHFPHVETVVFVPHPHPRLPLGIAADGVHRGRLPGHPRPPARTRHHGATRGCRRPDRSALRPVDRHGADAALQEQHRSDHRPPALERGAAATRRILRRSAFEPPTTCSASSTPPDPRCRCSSAATLQQQCRSCLVTSPCCGVTCATAASHS